MEEIRHNELLRRQASQGIGAIAPWESIRAANRTGAERADRTKGILIIVMLLCEKVRRFVFFYIVGSSLTMGERHLYIFGTKILGEVLCEAMSSPGSCEQ